MVALFAGLKWKLVTSRLRATRGATRAWVIVGFCVAGILLLLAAFGLGMLRTVPDIAPLLIAMLFAAQLVAWVLTPLIAFGVDETVDPQRFALLPLRTPQLQRGLLVSSLVGYLPVANVIVLVGAAIAVSAPWWLLPVALVCAAVQLVMCVVLSRAAATSLSALMSSRRGRDLGMAVGFGVFIIYFGLSALAGSSGSEEQGTQLASGVLAAAGILRWTPPGALAVLPSQLAAGDWGAAAVGAAITLVVLAAGWWWWSAALRRSLTTVVSSTSSSAPAGKREMGHSTADSIGGMARLVAGRDAVLSWRDPMRRIPWLMVTVIAVAWPFIVVHGHGSMFAVLLAAVLVGAQAGNHYGVEGTGLWLHIVAYGDRMRARGEVLGHILSALVPGSVVVLVALLVHAWVRDDWWMLPAAAGVCLAALLGSLAMAGYLSAALPYAMPQSRKSMFASSVPGQKGRTAGGALGVLFGGLAWALPAAGAALAALLVAPWWGWVALVVGLVTGAIALWWLTRAAADKYLESAPEILAVVAAGDRV